MSAHRDPTFDEVARREQQWQRDAQHQQRQAANDAEWRASPEYRRMRRARVVRLVAKAKAGSRT